MSAELTGQEPAAYAQNHLGDLILFEAPGVEANGPLERWLVDPIMKSFHGLMERGKVSSFCFPLFFFLFFFSSLFSC